MSAIERSYLPSLGEGLWNLDAQQLELQVDGILHLPAHPAPSPADRPFPGRLPPQPSAAAAPPGTASASASGRARSTGRGVQRHVRELANRLRRAARQRAALPRLYRDGVRLVMG